jgi:hypothetical protein
LFSETFGFSIYQASILSSFFDGLLWRGAAGMRGLLVHQTGAIRWRRWLALMLPRPASIDDVDPNGPLRNWLQRTSRKMRWFSGVNAAAPARSSVIRRYFDKAFLRFFFGMSGSAA